MAAPSRGVLRCSLVVALKGAGGAPSLRPRPLQYCATQALTVRAVHAGSSSVKAASQDKDIVLDDEEFRVLVIPGHTKVPERKQEARFAKRDVPPPRYKSMKLGEDWTNIWPAAHSFKWSTVPFPVRQGFVEKSENDGIPPSKYANAELMKIPNFLHLTPNHVKKHCAALKELCSEWPAGLPTDADCDAHFPIEVITRDYISDSASVRDPRARPVAIKAKLSSLRLDYHARDKLIRLAGSRYDSATDTLTLETDRCPLKKQNYDHAMYLLTALYAESWKTEPWEAEKTLADMEKYFWTLNPSKAAIVQTLRAMKQKSTVTKESEKIPSAVQTLTDKATEDEIVCLPLVKEYEQAVTQLFNQEEDIKSVDRYKNAVKQLLLNCHMSA